MAELLLRLSLPLSLIKNTFFRRRPSIKFLAFEMFLCDNIVPYKALCENKLRARFKSCSLSVE